MHSLASHPEYKMLTVRSIPHISRRSADFSTYQWPGLVKHLHQMLIANASMEEGPWAIFMITIVFHEVRIIVVGFGV